MAVPAQFVRFADVPAFTLVEGVAGRPRVGDGAMANPFEFSADACGPDGAPVIDVFCPTREDYRERWEASSDASA